MNFALALVISWIGVADDKPAEALQKELKPFQGTWVLVRGERNGMKVDFTELKEQLILEIKDNKWIFTGADKGRIVAIDPKNNPKSMDIKSIEEGRKGAVDEAIFKFDDDTLTICLNQGMDKKRPTEFKSVESDVIVMVLKRKKS
jgi:uncharacterized protein (TIGR03067 family)